MKVEKQQRLQYWCLKISEEYYNDVYWKRYEILYLNHSVYEQNVYFDLYLSQAGWTVQVVIILQT